MLLLIVSCLCLSLMLPCWIAFTLACPHAFCCPASPVVITKPASLKKQEVPPPDRELMHRDEAYKVMAEYISGVNEDDIRVRSSDKEKGYKVLSTYGIQGLGKTVRLTRCCVCCIN